MALEFGFKTDVGKVRTNNEDSLLTDPEHGVFIVADGMGGHNSGEVASKMAIEVVRDNLVTALSKKEIKPDSTQITFGQNDPKLSDEANFLASSIRLANQVVFTRSQNFPQNAGMGTTLVSVLAKQGSYVIAWVGDSRIYLYRHDHLEQVTVDHSLVQEQVAKGLITNSQAEESQFKNILTRAIGAKESVDVDVHEINAMDGDYLVLCSDGLTRGVSDEKISEVIKSGANAQAISDKLVELALEAGGRDNVTVIVLNNKIESVWDKFLKAVGKT